MFRANLSGKRISDCWRNRQTPTEISGFSAGVKHTVDSTAGHTKHSHISPTQEAGGSKQLSLYYKYTHTTEAAVFAFPNHMSEFAWVNLHLPVLFGPTQGKTAQGCVLRQSAWVRLGVMQTTELLGWLLRLHIQGWLILGFLPASTTFASDQKEEELRGCCPAKRVKFYRQQPSLYS